MFIRVESKLLSTYKATPPPLLLFIVLGELNNVYPVILKGLRGVSVFNHVSAIEIILGFFYQDHRLTYQVYQNFCLGYDNLSA